MYDKGVGIPVDKDRAAKLYHDGCNRLNSESCNNLARMYATGDGLKVDKKKAIRLYDQTCGRGNHEACDALARLTQ